MKGDKTVNACIESKLERERSWSKKSSTAVKSDSMIAPIVKNSLEARQTQPITRNQCMNRGKIALKKTISEEVKETWNTRVKKTNYARRLCQSVD